MRLHGGPWAGLLAGAALAALAGCGSYEQRCDLNPYACPTGGSGGGDSTGTHADTPKCGPCEVEDSPGSCAPVRLLSDGDCPWKDTCSPELQCKRAPGESCKEGSDCATGACDTVTNQCVTCAGDDDCAALPAAPLCLAGWCRRGPGAACEVDFACISNRCNSGVCAPCAQSAECASGLCDDDTHRCLAAPGEPCAAEAECASGQCQSGLCVL